MGRVQVVGAAVLDGSGRDPADVDVSIEDGHIATSVPPAPTASAWTPEA
ncbi:hypothetical protein LCL61_00595 [Amycolatopsis coloradensis]|uniref:Uncharacterized protein n=1 Tax=Amycolatopsis coloradensis TaxID=76021 RepID=A0ACD5B3Z5_9PSEU